LRSSFLLTLSKENLDLESTVDHGMGPHGRRVAGKQSVVAHDENTGDADALAKLLLAKGIITEEEFKAQRRAREPPQSAEPDAIMNPP
jgi:hypothetical protein